MSKAHLVAPGEATRQFHVRHGVLHAEKNLTDEGKQYAEHVGAFLVAASVPKRSLILSSPDSASYQTASIIKNRLTQSGSRGPVLYTSPLLHQAGDFPHAVLSLRHLVDAALDEHGTHLNNRRLVIVTHRPLLEAVAGQPDLASNAVVTVPDLDEWQNPNFSPMQQRKFLPVLQQAILL